MELKDTKAASVWDIFGEICKVPRPSKQEEKICRWVKEFATEHGLEYRSDPIGNIVITVPPTRNYQDSPPLVLQGHLDMVCEKTPDSDHDFTHDAIKTIEKDGWLYADRTTLGADNGIGVAMALALAIEPELEHPPLELLFTVDEETGLTGASELRPDFIRGRRLINIDTEDEGVFTIGCAGGEQTELMLPVNMTDSDPDLQQFDLRITGLAGGHSGVNIHEQRANAIKLLGRVLGRINEKVEIHVCSIAGGSAHNAIPRDAVATLLTHPDNMLAIAEITADLQATLKKENGPLDSSLQISLSESAHNSSMLLDNQSVAKVISVLNALPNGVDRYSFEVEGLVETSNNIATIATNQAGSAIEIMSSQRSCISFALRRITNRIEAVSQLAGGEAKTWGRYPGWEPNPASELLQISSDVYKRVMGREAKIEAIHAGLECGLLGEKFEGMDMISIGATIENPHSPQERVNIESVDQVWNFLLALLPALK